MAILKSKDIRTMKAADLEKQLKDLRNDLLKQRAITATGGAPESPAGSGSCGGRLPAS